MIYNTAERTPIWIKEKDAGNNDDTPSVTESIHTRNSTLLNNENSVLNIGSSY
jgi:hypothetical protein